MKDILAFITSSLPWIAMGMFLAVSFAAQRSIRKGEPISKKIQKLSWAPTICCFIVAALEVVDSNMNGAATWFILGAAMILLSFLRAKQTEQMIKDEIKAREAYLAEQEADSEDI